jgi:undecaprenyl-diphosphatase
MTYWQAFLLAVVEGLTEFLPISSTGHMIIASALLGIQPTPFTKLFTVVIQFGAILSVFVVYWRRFFQSLDFYFKLLAAFAPVVVVGLLLKKYIDRLLESVSVVAVMLLIGGIVLLFIDRWFPQENSNDGGRPVTTPGYKQAFIIGCFQCLAVVPGVSRSAATIIGGLSQKLTRKAAAEFAFFLAMPTMAAAAVKDSWDYYESGLRLGSNDLLILLFGNAVAFVVALAAIRFFVGFVTKYGFRAFGIYRILAGSVLLVMLALGVKLQLID